MGKWLLVVVLLVPVMAQAQSDRISTLAPSMAPGSWAELTGGNISEEGLLIEPGGAGYRSPYAHSGAWDPIRRKLHFIGSDHGDWQCIHVVYDADTNVWSRGPDTELTGAGTSNHQPNNSACLHGFDHLEIDPAQGDLYWWANAPEVWKLPLSSSTWAKIPNWTSTQGEAIARGFAFWSGAMTGASAGALYQYNCGSFWGGTPPPGGPGNGADGQVLIYSPGSNTWISDGDAIVGFGYQGGYTYQCFADYSPLYNVGFFGGGGAGGTHVWRLNSDRTVTALTDAPVNLGVQYGNVANDPVTGNFIVLESNQMYEFDPRGSGTWTTLDASHSPPAGASGYVGYPNTPVYNGMFSTPITNYGVIMYVGCGSNTCKAFLYKHAASAAPANLALFRLGVLLVTLASAAALPILFQNELPRVTAAVREKVRVRR